MIRTQVSLPEDEYEAAKLEAQRRGISFAELIRQSLRSVLPRTVDAPWMQFAGMVDSGDPESSQHIDAVVYGAPD